MPDCFEGFSMETLAFFAAVKFNNNREFLNENRDLFERAVKRPLVLLAQELAPVAQEIDLRIDPRPSRAVSGATCASAAINRRCAIICGSASTPLEK